VVILRNVSERAIVSGHGLEYTSLDSDVAITYGSMQIDYAGVIEEAVWTSDPAMNIANTNPTGRDILLDFGTPTIISGDLLSYEASIEGIVFLDWDGSSWAVQDFGLMNGYDGNVTIVMEVALGSADVQIDYDYEIVLEPANPSLGTYGAVHTGYGDPGAASGIAEFTITGNGDGATNWIGFDPEITVVGAEMFDGASNHTGTLGGSLTCAHDGSEAFTADFGASLNSAVEYYIELSDGTVLTVDDSVNPP
jgi:hypothetical protein